MEERKTNTTEAIIIAIVVSIPVIFLCAVFNSLGKVEADRQIRQQICKQVYTDTKNYINCNHKVTEETIKLLKPIK